MYTKVWAIFYWDGLGSGSVSSVAGPRPKLFKGDTDTDPDLDPNPTRVQGYSTHAHLHLTQNMPNINPSKAQIWYQNLLFMHRWSSAGLRFFISFFLHWELEPQFLSSLSVLPHPIFFSPNSPCLYCIHMNSFEFSFGFLTRSYALQLQNWITIPQKHILLKKKKK